MKILMRLLALFAVVVLAGCKLNVPAFDGASVEIHVAGRVKSTGVLDDLQVKRLREWLAERRTGWERRLESTGPAPLLVKLERQGKVVAWVNITQNYVKVGDWVRGITAEERDMLHLLLTAFLSSNKRASLTPEPAR